jgi:hypothetical protein
MGLSVQGRRRIQEFVTPKVRSIDAQRITAVEDRLEALNSRVGRNQRTLETKIDNNQAQITAAPHRVENYSQVPERLARFENKLQSVA